MKNLSSVRFLGTKIIFTFSDAKQFITDYNGYPKMYIGNWTATEIKQVSTTGWLMMQ